MFPNIIIPHPKLTESCQLDDEWRKLQFMDPNDLPKFEGSRKDVVIFWGMISRIVNTSDQRRFPTISKLTTTLLCLPHSNADVERIFSHVTVIKTKARNKMKTKTLDAIIMTKQSLRCTCVEFQPDKSICKCINIDMYDSSPETSDSD